MKIVGSSPTCPTIGGVAHLGERIPCTDKVAGSIPVASTMRVSYNGITLGFQPNDTGSIPVTRSNVAVAEWLRATVCKTVLCRFDSCRQLQWSHRSVRPRTLDCQSSNMGSNPIGTAIGD